MNKNDELVHPWENTEALGAITGEHLKGNYPAYISLVVGYQTDHVKPEDCVEHDALWLEEKDKLSIVVLSEKPWKPVWRRVSNRRASVGNNLVVGQDDTYYNVLLNHNGHLQKLWLSERVLEKFTWGEKNIEEIWQQQQGNQVNLDSPGT